MIKEAYLKKLNDHLLEFSKQVGLPIGDYRIDHGLNSVAEIKFRHDFANQYREKISEVMEMFTKVPGIFEICDFQSEDVLRGGEVRSVGIEVKRRYWYEGHIEEEWDEEQERLDTDPEYAKKKQEEELAEKRKYWRDYLIPIPKPPKDAADEAYLTLDYKYYDMIKSGEKTTEFRAYSPFWVKRLLSHPIKTVRFQRGYGGPGHPPPEQMVWSVKDIVLYEIGTRRECPADNPSEGIMPTHIAIDLAERLDTPAKDDVADESESNTKTAQPETAKEGGVNMSADTLTLVDIGVIESIVGVRDPNCEEPDVTGYVEAHGERGSIGFYLLHATSRGRIETDHGRLWTIPLIVMIEKFYKENRDTMKIGEVVELPSVEESLAIAKGLGFEDLKRLSPNKAGSVDKVTWVDASGLPTVEPGWFRPMMKVLGVEPVKPVMHKTVEFLQPEGNFSPVYKGYDGEFYADARDYARSIMPDDEIGSYGKPCIIFPDLEPGVVVVPQEAANLILEGRKTTKLNIVVLRNCVKAGDPVVIEVEDEEPAPNGDQDGSSGKSKEASTKSTADQDAKPDKDVAHSKLGRSGSSKRWGENHGPTVTVRAFAQVAERLRTLVPEKDRAQFVTDAINEKLDARHNITTE